MGWPRVRAVALLLTVIGTVLVVRMLLVSRSELRAGEAALARRDPEAAAVAFRRAARAYVPGNPFAAQAMDRLRALAKEAQSAGRSAEALFVWRSLRGAILTSRSFFIPHRARLLEAEAALADVMAELGRPVAGAFTHEEAHAEVRARALSQLREEARPYPSMVALALCGWLLFLGASFAFFTRGIEADGRFRRARAKPLSLLALAGLLVFACGLRWA